MTPPTTSEFKTRYPAFASVADPTIEVWLTDAERYVTDAWGADYAPGIMAYAAHQLELAGYGSGAGSGGAAAGSGVSSFKSGSLSVSFSSAFSAGGWSATRYGDEFLAMLHRHRGGPITVSATPSPCGGYP